VDMPVEYLLVVFLPGCHSWVTSELAGKPQQIGDHGALLHEEEVVLGGHTFQVTNCIHLVLWGAANKLPGLWLFLRSSSVRLSHKQFGRSQHVITQACTEIQVADVNPGCRCPL